MDTHVSAIDPPARLLNDLDQALIDRPGFVNRNDPSTHS